MDKEDEVYIQNRIIVSHKKDETLPFPITHLDFQGIMLSEIIWKERHTGISGPCACASSTHRSHGTHSSRHWGHLPGPKDGTKCPTLYFFQQVGQLCQNSWTGGWDENPRSFGQGGNFASFQAPMTNCDEYSTYQQTRPRKGRGKSFQAHINLATFRW